jgi:hypothetical protein
MLAYAKESAVAGRIAALSHVKGAKVWVMTERRRLHHRQPYHR